MINSVQLKNFGPLVELDWQNLGQINLVIGNNGSGKSFLLKALYSAVRTLEDYKRGDNPESVNEILWKKLYWTFQPENKIGDLVTKSSDSPLFLGLTFKRGGIIGEIIDDIIDFNYSFGKDTIKAIGTLENRVESLPSNSIFLPTKEVLSLHHLILQSSEQNKLFGFDATYVDLAKALQPKQFSDISYSDSTMQELIELAKRDPNNKTIQNFLEIIIAQQSKKKQREEKKIAIQNKIFIKCRNQLEKAINGKIEYDESESRWYFKKGKERFSIGITAEGIKKIAILDTLLSNGYLSENSIIFIDEPESALHPEAISKLLDIIAILAKHGIQFFMASHSYFVIKKLFLIAQEQKLSIPVLSYQNDAWVQSDLKDDLPDNPIIDESIRLYEQQLDMD